MTPISRRRPSLSTCQSTTTPSPPSITSTASPVTSAFSPSSISSLSSSSSSPSVITSASSVLTPGPLVAPGAGVQGHHHHQQQFLHILHPGIGGGVGGKMEAHHLHRIPVVVQSLPLMYTTAVRSPSSLHNNAIMLPLLDNHKSHHSKGETKSRLCLSVSFPSLFICCIH
ncbi:unnamed protein product [Oncorhynchus mykiss]|uniref:Uncharacterized protein n=1 Tax=Oncorhynchus mykiss TaxID=8022 RepID=A0A060YZQ5_ONCMY|nr:unnamed protein product [Oncorhynchus mykiss]